MREVTMGELNKQANAIINAAVESGETVTITKHGRVIAEVRPVADGRRQAALDYLLSTEPVPVDEPIQYVIDMGRQRGLS